MARVAKYGAKKTREVSVSEEGWMGMLAIASIRGCTGVSDLLEQLGRNPGWMNPKIDSSGINKNPIAAIFPMMIQNAWLSWVPYSRINNNLPSAPGIYIIVDSQNAFLYVGKANSLKGRLRRHQKLDELDSCGASKIYYFCADIESLNLVEQALIAVFQPKLNIRHTGNKQATQSTQKEGDQSVEIEINEGCSPDTSKKDDGLIAEAGERPSVRDTEVNKRVDAAIASVLPTIPIKSRVAIAKAFKKLTAKLAAESAL